MLFTHPLRIEPWELTASIADVVRAVQVAEEVGFDAVCVNDHVAMPREAVIDLGRMWSDPVACMGYLAAKTNRIRLYAAVLITPYRSPLLVAKALATVDFLSAGRLTVGFGAGYLKAEFDALGVPFEARGHLTDEYIPAIKELWTSDFASFQGAHVRFSDICIEPKPVQKPHPPVIIGGNTKAAMRRAARLGDGWHPFQIEPQELPPCIEYIYSQPGFEARPAPFEIVTPLNLVDRTPDGSGKGRLLTRQELVERVDGWRQAGATTIWVTAFHANSIDQYLDTLRDFGESVIARFAPEPEVPSHR